MYKLVMSVYKEVLLLRRDPGALIILFVMPLVLVIAITLIQDSTFKTATESKIPILLVDNDKGEVSKMVLKNLGESSSFLVITQGKGKPITEQFAKDKVFNGEYQMAIVIPAQLSSGLKAKVNGNVQKIMEGFTAVADTVATPSAPAQKTKTGWCNALAATPTKAAGQIIWIVGCFFS